MRQVKFLDVTEPKAMIQDALAAMSKVIESGQFISGKYVATFEEKWAEICGAQYCVACGSGGAALILALKALDLPIGSRVIVPALSFAATAMAVLEAGYIPRYCDVDSNGLIDVHKMTELALHERAVAVIPVHLYGQLVNMKPIVEVAKQFGMQVIEDAAQAHCAMKRVHGTMACFSFYPAKNLGAFGEAGAIVTDHSDLAYKARQIANYGVAPGSKYEHKILGSNLRMDEIQAAILYAKMGHLDYCLAKRKEVALRYAANGVHSIARAKTNVWHLYPVKCEQPAKVRDELGSWGIATGLHYPIILPELEALRGNFGSNRHNYKGSWPIAKAIAEHHITLPMGPHLSNDDIDYISEGFLNACSKNI